MKQILLAVVLVAVPIGVFAGGYRFVLAREAASQALVLGDLSGMAKIVGDVQGLVAAKDLGGAAVRITDLETAWDVAEPDMRPMDTAAWGNVDEAIDAALTALRMPAPDAGQVVPALDHLLAQMAMPGVLIGDSSGPGAQVVIEGVTITDDQGRALPCEDMLKELTASLAGQTVSEGDQSIVDSFQAKATERCNADDDRHADEFSAKALAVLVH